MNRDPSAARMRGALREARIDPAVCVWWNASPYHLGYKGPLRDGDRASGARYLREAVALCRDLRVVVAMGEGAHAVAASVWQGREKQLPRLIEAPHPMIYGRGGAERLVILSLRMREVAALLLG